MAVHSAATRLTSLSFLLILNRRRSTAGQTMYIVIVKMIGTAAAAAGFAALYPTRMLLWVFFTTMVVIDIIYVVQLHRGSARKGCRPGGRSDGESPIRHRSDMAITCHGDPANLPPSVDAAVVHPVTSPR